MAYLVFSSHKGEEIGRRRLEGPVTIGRSPECEVSLRDHLLSRRHCRLEKTEDGWLLTDLGSKNGTILHGQPVRQYALRDGDAFTIGRVKVRFRTGSLAPSAETAVGSGRQKRPADPFDALSGTVAGFRYEPSPHEKHLRDVDQFPSPKPVMTDSGRFVAVTDSGRFVGVTDDVWLTDPADANDLSSPAPYSGPGIVEVGAEARSEQDLGTHVVARPKAPEGADPTAAPKVELPGPPPLPPKRPARLWLAPFLKKLGRQLRKPLGRWAAILPALGGFAAVVDAQV
jgi:pSer/pThr/pTyr-binding forkhead associated (FHA) protein